MQCTVIEVATACRLLAALAQVWHMHRRVGAATAAVDASPSLAYRLSDTLCQNRSHRKCVLARLRSTGRLEGRRSRMCLWQEICSARARLQRRAYASPHAPPCVPAHAHPSIPAVTKDPSRPLVPFLRVTAAQPQALRVPMDYCRRHIDDRVSQGGEG